jgi:Helicase associated domain
MEIKAIDVSGNWTHQTKRTSIEVIVQVIEETQESEAQSKTMISSKFDPAVFFAQDKMQVDIVEGGVVNHDDENNNKKRESFTLLGYPFGIQHPLEKDVELKGPKHAKSETALQNLQTKWNIMFHHLINYKLVHGDCLVPNRYKADMSLGLWVSTQRRQVCSSVPFEYYMHV